MNRPFTPEQIAIIEREWPAGTDKHVIAAMIGRKPHAVQLAASARKIRRSPSYLKTLRSQISASQFMGA